MRYEIVRNKNYDYAGQSYASIYPNLHKYPATMLPQIGIDILKEVGACGGAFLDPYCGSGSSFASAVEIGFKKMWGFDLNPLAILITKVKFTPIDFEKLIVERNKFRNDVYEFLKYEHNFALLREPNITNIDYWFSQDVIRYLQVLKRFIDSIGEKNIQDFFLIPFSETVRDASYTKNSEFKLYRMKEKEILLFNPDVVTMYLRKFDETLLNYKQHYLPKLNKDVKVELSAGEFEVKENFFDAVLTSPPYGDSRTTVAYGQFSTLSNEWLGIPYARKIDSMLMGGAKSTKLMIKGVLADSVKEISTQDHKRALEVSAFYQDLGASIKKVAKSIKKGGVSVYVVGNRTVKGVKLPTDQFVAETFEDSGFKHLFTYERALSNKTMPLKNSPTNISGKTIPTMSAEYIVVCRKK